MTTKETIRGWIESGIKDGMKYMPVYCDDYDYTDYPVYSRDDVEFWEKYKTPGEDMQRLIEVYDLTMDIDAQMEEFRAVHKPEKKE